MILASRLMLYSRVTLSSGRNLASSPMHELSRMPAMMNTTIRTFEYTIQVVNGGVCTVENLKSIRADNFQVLVDDIFNADSSKRIFA